MPPRLDGRANLVDYGRELGQKLLVGGEVDDEAAPRKKCVAHALQLGEQRRPIIARFVEHGLDRLVKGDALRRLTDVAEERVPRGEAQARVLVA